jgi:glutaredoxin
MDYRSPQPTCFTIYSKSGCKNCTNVKKLLNQKQISFIEINCDNYIIDSKIEFMQFINKIANSNISEFPIVFSNSIYIGCYNETNNYITNMSNIDNCF